MEQNEGQSLEEKLRARADESDDALSEDFKVRWARLNQRRLARIVRPTSEDAFFDGLKQFLWRFLSSSQPGHSPASKALKLELHRIEMIAERFEADLNAISDDAWVALKHSSDMFRSHPDHVQISRFSDLDWDELARNINLLAEVAFFARHWLPVSKGRKADAAFNELLRCLALLYEDSTGQHPLAKMSVEKDSATSPFLSFVVEILIGFAPEHLRSSSAIAAAARRVIQE